MIYLHPMYTLRRNRRSKHLRLTIKLNGEVTVTAPLKAPESLIQRFMTDRATWIQSRLDHIKTLPKLGEGTYKTHKDIALHIATARTKYFNQFYNFTYKNITIKNQKTRWGSCSKTGNLNFNYKIALLPEKLADYIVVHELCHLGEFNHSYKFWNLVAKIMPNYRELRAELKKIHLG